MNEICVHHFIPSLKSKEEVLNHLKSVSSLLARVSRFRFQTNNSNELAGCFFFQARWVSVHIVALHQEMFGLACRRIGGDCILFHSFLLIIGQPSQDESGIEQTLEHQFPSMQDEELKYDLLRGNYRSLAEDLIHLLQSESIKMRRDVLCHLSVLDLSELDQEQQSLVQSCLVDLDSKLPWSFVRERLQASLSS